MESNPVTWHYFTCFVRWGDNTYYRFCDRLNDIVLIRDRQTGIYIECQECKKCDLKMEKV